MSTALSVLLDVAVVVLITVLTGYFVAQEFGYMADESPARNTASGTSGAVP